MKVVTDLTGPDFEPTAATRYYAQYFDGDVAGPFEFGPTGAQATLKLRQRLWVRGLRLPTKGVPGKGKYPNRIRSHSITRDGTHHFELYSGTRLVVRGLRYRSSMTNLDFHQVTGLHAGEVPAMSEGEYYATLALITLARKAR